MKKRNYIGAAECRIWMRNTYVGKHVLDLSREDLEASDADIAERFNITSAVVGNIRRELGIYNARDRKYIAYNLRAKGVEAPKQEPEKPARPKLPDWCKVGQWVFHNGCLLGKIEGFEEEFKDGSTHPTTYVVLRSYDRHNKLPFTRLPKQIQPVLFRPYTYDEAKGLLGKVIEHSCDEGPLRGRVERSRMITSVTNDKDGVFINGDLFIFLSKRLNATIDGVPIGVPALDKDALDACSPEE